MGLNLPTTPSAISRRTVLAGAASTGFAMFAGGHAKAADLKSIVIAEPVHQIGYLPLYMAVTSGAFAKRGLDVKLITATGGAHVTALVSGQVWGNIGGPESDAMANVGKADPLITICNVVARANEYMIAKKGLIGNAMPAAQIREILKGKKYALNRFGGTPDILGRWYLQKMGVDTGRDVTIINQADTAATPLMLRQGAADITITTEPQLTFGREMGVWDEPFFSFPSLGDYAYSTISVRKSTITSDRKTVQAFVDVMRDQLRLVATNRGTVERAVRNEFPTLSPSGVKGALDRMYADSIWSKDGFVSEKSYALDMQIVAKSGEFTKPAPYSEVVDMRFVKMRPGV
jgi:NitT/TauT family transport system substrate-binding protein